LRSTYGFRVRGIYATAIAKILVDRGLKPSDISEKLSRRLRAEVEGYVDVTVKNSDDNKTLLIIVGMPGAVEESFKVLSNVLRDLDRGGLYPSTWSSEPQHLLRRQMDAISRLP